MNEKLYASRTFGSGNQLSYYLLAESGRELYGVAVVKRDAYGGTERESALFTEERDRALTVLRKLMGGLVTPVTLLDILDDMVE